MSAITTAQPEPSAQAAHAPWCREHTAEGCISETIHIDDLPVAIWATRFTNDPDHTVRIVMDGPVEDGTVMIDLRMQDQ
jgi:hypothetical protein